MEARSIARYVRVSPRKADQVLRLIRGMQVERAQEVLSFTPRPIARQIGKVLKSAVANATAREADETEKKDKKDKKQKLDVDELFVKTAVAGAARQVSRGYTEELEHWAWCIQNRAPENVPRCHPKVALADAVIALVTNIAARQGRRIEFEEAWFDPCSDATPEGVKPDVNRYV